MAPQETLNLHVFLKPPPNTSEVNGPRRYRIQHQNPSFDGFSFNFPLAGLHLLGWAVGIQDFGLGSEMIGPEGPHSSEGKRACVAHSVWNRFEP